MASILPLLMATSLTYVSDAVTTLPFATIVSKPMPVLSSAAEQAFYAKLATFDWRFPGGRRGRHAVRYHDQARHDGGANCLADAPGRSCRVSVRLDFRLTCPLA